MLYTNINNKETNINEWSFKRYAKFYNHIITNDDEFEEKIYKIYDLIFNQKLENIKEIAEKSNCSADECIIKINYLKNKLVLDNLYIDTTSYTIKRASTEDQELLKKYKNPLYISHFSLDEIALALPNTTKENLESQKEKIWNDLLYLNNKCLLNGISLNKIDKKIIYYTVEKHNKENDYVSLECPRCGAINDINKYSKIRCCYCNSIIEDTYSK